MKNFDPTKPVQTRDGRKARVLCTDLNTVAGWTIAFVITNDSGNDVLFYAYPDGSIKNNPGSDCDLVNVVEKTTEVRFLKESLGQNLQLFKTAHIFDTKSWEIAGKLIIEREDGDIVNVTFSKEVN